MPSAFVNIKMSPGRAPTFFQILCRINCASYRVAEFQLVIANRMSTDHRAIRFRHFRQAAAQDLFQNFRRTGGWKREDGERGNRSAAHGVHITEGVSGGYLAEKFRIIQDRREKIHGLHDRQIIREAIYGCIIAGFEANDHVRINLRGKALEHRVQHAGTQFRSAARGLCGGGEPDLFRQCHLSVEQMG